MELIIAEKPSVAQQIATVLGANQKKQGYFEGGNYLVSWCIGHLVGLAPAECYDSALEHWSLEDLPIVPDNFMYVGNEDKKQQLDNLSNLMHRGDVTSVINACDSGREGELIFRLVYDFVQCKKSIQRLWVSSMEDTAILEGFQNLKEGGEMEHLYQSALCRAKADWLIGINTSRLYSCIYHQTLNVGRVISPTLSMVAERNAVIQEFQSTPFFFAELDCGDFTFQSKRYSNKQEVNDLVEMVKQTPMKVKSIEKKEKTQNPPTLYDLTTLQRDSNRTLGFTAQQTLDFLQSLYEKKIVTYPRTDSNFITPDMEHTLSEVVNIIMGKLKLEGTSPSKRNNVIDSSKVTDHHGILPTMTLSNTVIENLPYGEREVLSLVMYRTLQAVSEVFRFEETIVTVECGGNIFATSGKTVISQGFKKFEKEKSDKEEVFQIKILVGNELPLKNVKLKEGRTTPPKQFTEDTLLRAMEKCTDFSGIGTASTRAKVIEKLVEIRMLERVGEGKVKFLLPTDKGMALVRVLPESMKSSSTTADWEEKLTEIENGQLSPDIFMEEISATLQTLVTSYAHVSPSPNDFPSQYPPIGKCPRCGKDVVENPNLFACVDKSCGFALWKNNRFFTSKKKKVTLKLVQDLLSTGRTRLTGCYSEKTGYNYDCTVVMDKGEGNKVNFKMEFDPKKEK